VQIIEGFASFAINALGKKVQRCMTDLICFVSIESVIPEMFYKANSLNIERMFLIRFYE
jgi:hypothetical protein